MQFCAARKRGGGGKLKEEEEEGKAWSGKEAEQRKEEGGAKEGSNLQGSSSPPLPLLLFSSRPFSDFERSFFAREEQEGLLPLNGGGSRKKIYSVFFFPFLPGKPAFLQGPRGQEDAREIATKTHELTKKR